MILTRLHGRSYIQGQYSVITNSQGAVDVVGTAEVTGAEVGLSSRSKKRWSLTDMSFSSCSSGTPISIKSTLVSWKGLDLMIGSRTWAASPLSSLFINDWNMLPRKSEHQWQVQGWKLVAAHQWCQPLTRFPPIIIPWRQRRSVMGSSRRIFSLSSFRYIFPHLHQHLHSATSSSPEAYLPSVPTYLLPTSWWVYHVEFFTE